MVNYFPKFYLDELLISGVCRWHRHTLSHSWAGTLSELFGPGVRSISSDLPSHMTALSGNLRCVADVSVATLIRERTLFPYYAGFVGDERQQSLISAATCGRGARSIFASLGLTAISAPRFFRTCPFCLDEDAPLGETYWRRAHQLQGVHFCVRHRVPLIETDILMRAVDGGVTSDCSAVFDMSVHEYLQHMSDRDSAVLLALSERGVKLLSEKRGTLQQQRIAFRDLLGKSGFLKGSDVINCTKFIEQFRRFYSHRLLSLLGSEFDDSYVHSWPRDTLKVRVGTHQPIRRLLIEYFLESRADGCDDGVVIGYGPWLCKNPAADHFGTPTIDRYTILGHHKYGARAGRFLCSCGFEFTARLDVADANGQPVKMRVTKYGDTMTAKIRAFAKKGYSPSKTARIFGVALPAVKTILSESSASRRSGDEGTARRMREKRAHPAQRTSSSSYREPVNWAALDDDLCRRVHAAKKEILSNGPPMRVTKVAIKRLVGDHRLGSAGCSRYLAKAVGALSAAQESVDDLQCRKARWVYDHWPDDKPMTAWRLRHIVGVKSGSRRIAVTELIDRLVAGESTLPHTVSKRSSRRDRHV